MWGSFTAPEVILLGLNSDFSPAAFELKVFSALLTILLPKSGSVGHNISNKFLSQNISTMF